ncbi:uncharacterized protein LOC125680722 isoform X1 [Ostrea edulis]|uniref:uncharacterized protein LOC125680722 isoform X1 n=1 Tax=Ostrea edulis TaxID=37623 RepID=UPI0024AEFEBF|nr:uncharacterized protein LOC125680722 isoform X1 [Ostrea edulis]XP_056010833.1 uncharacterized protein LOC125680722 isoform X2 [Ostrea edulis]XP_056010835.1 uncharacterized protein LOC125680722 isoform X1 [Ostrea edulis]XP_056010836.1 uncharacterized protein LOC125680722 isoform X1 [Ostrea edulis]XP_056010837.1 uncharacterized protein LOC125680722 isoform X1 [Ostrea edulis]
MMYKNSAPLVLLELLSLLNLTSTQNIQIEAQPPTVDLRQDDLVILCSVTSPSQIETVYTIQLMKNNSGSTLANVVSIRSGSGVVSWQDSNLQNRATATGSVSSPQTAQLRLSIPKDNVQCPADFTGYKCTMNGYGTGSIGSVNQETNQIFVSYRIQPTLIEMPRVRILGEFSSTAQRQFPVGSALQLTCTGQTGSDPRATIRWCAKTANAFTFTGLPQTPIHSEASLSGCQYTRSSTITYNLTNSDTYTQFLCESGNSGLCETGTAKQYFNLTIEGNNSTPKHHKIASDEKAEIIGSVVGAVVFIGLLVILVFMYRRYTCNCNIDLKKNRGDGGVVTTDSKQGECYINMAAQNRQTERDHYEQLPEERAENQYDHLSVQDTPGSNAQTYETLQDSAGENKYAKLSYDKEHAHHSPSTGSIYFTSRESICQPTLCAG